jgi:hypothetical protein
MLILGFWIGAYQMWYSVGLYVVGLGLELDGTLKVTQGITVTLGSYFSP